MGYNVQLPIFFFFFPFQFSPFSPRVAVNEASRKESWIPSLADYVVITVTVIMQIRIIRYVPTAFLSPTLDLGIPKFWRREISSASAQGNEASKAAVTSPSHAGICCRLQAFCIFHESTTAKLKWTHVNCCRGAAGIFLQVVISFPDSNCGEALLILKPWTCCAVFEHVHAWVTDSCRCP